MIRLVAGLFVVGVTIFGADEIFGQAYPYKPLRILASDPGGNGDFNARLVAQGLAGPLGQSVIVDNRSGIAAIEKAAKATPDGYILLCFGSSFWVWPFLKNSSTSEFGQIKVERDLAPVIMTTTATLVLVVHPSVPAKSVHDLIALAKAKPGMLNYGHTPASASHLAAELFKSMAGIVLVGIPYRAAGPALNDVIGNQVQVFFATASSVAPHLKTNRLRPLAVTKAKPSVLFPGLPPIAESLPGYESVSVQGIWVPAKTPEPIISRLNLEIARFLSRSEVKERLLATGTEAAAGSREQFAAVIRSEMTRMGKLIKDLGL